MAPAFIRFLVVKRAESLMAINLGLLVSEIIIYLLNRTYISILQC